MKYGLTDKEYEDLVEVFRKSDYVIKVVLFGSRAMNTHKSGSDVDIAIFGQELTFNDYLALKVSCEELGLLQKVDLIRYESIKDEKLIDHIERVGIVLFSR